MFWVGFVSPENKLAGKWKGLGGKGRISPSLRTPSPFWPAFWAEENALRHFPHLIAFNRRSRSTVEQRWCTLYDCKIFSRDRLKLLVYITQKGARFLPDSPMVCMEATFFARLFYFIWYKTFAVYRTPCGSFENFPITFPEPSPDKRRRVWKQSEEKQNRQASWSCPDLN